MSDMETMNLLSTERAKGSGFPWQPPSPKGKGRNRGQKREVSSPAAALNLLGPPRPGRAGEGKAPASLNSLSSLNANLDQLHVRNTFLEHRAKRPPSLERFFVERTCHSLPCSGPPSAQSRGEALEELPPYMINTPTGSTINTMPPTPTGLDHRFMWELPPIDLRMNGTNNAFLQQMPAPVPVAILSLAEALKAPAPQAPPAPAPRRQPPATAPTNVNEELPSRGSALHRWGVCKPCAFVFQGSEGCKNAYNCEFCHLCEPGERKRRKKERKTFKKEVPRPRAAVGARSFDGPGTPP